MIRAIAACAVVCLATGCTEQPSLRPAPAPSALTRRPPAPVPRARLPAAPGRFAPAFTRTSEALDVSDSKSCAPCHASIAAQWRRSAHAASSFDNPIYRASVDRFRREVGNTASQFCAGCHDPALLAQAGMRREVRPDDPRAHAGIGCRTCHGVRRTTRDGNGSYQLARVPIPIPRDGDRASLAAHLAATRVTNLGTDLCLSCHRSFLGRGTGNGVHLSGMDDASVWEASGYAGSPDARVDRVAPNTCISCHMPPVAATLGARAAKRGKVRSHRFLGGHSWLAAMRGEASDLADARRRLTGVASIDIAALTSDEGKTTWLADGADVRPGQTLTVDVVVRNLRVGHRFPGGVGDAQDVWIEVDVRDARGRMIAAAGQDHRRHGAEDTHVLRALVADDRGQPRLQREVHLFRAGIVDHTIAPRDAVVTRFRFRLPTTPASATLPLSIDARLLHRTRNLALQRVSCASHRSLRGRAFAAARKRLGRLPLDPCAPQPITEIAQTRAAVGSGWRTVTLPRKAPGWRRLYEHGLALLHSVQEEVGEARRSLQAAQRALPATATAADRAKILLALGKVDGRQGRTAPALALFAQAAQLTPDHPAIDRARGDALARVWRWREAAAAYARVATKSPKSLRAWRRLGIARGSAGDPRGALEAARRGLALQPRDEALLRVQALALTSLGAPTEVRRAALAAYTRFRLPDRQSDLRVRCAKNSPTCARERNPVHVHEMATMVPRR